MLATLSVPSKRLASHEDQNGSPLAAAKENIARACQRLLAELGAAHEISCTNLKHHHLHHPPNIITVQEWGFDRASSSDAWSHPRPRAVARSHSNSSSLPPSGSSSTAFERQFGSVLEGLQAQLPASPGGLIKTVQWIV